LRVGGEKGGEKKGVRPLSSPPMAVKKGRGGGKGNGSSP